MRLAVLADIHGNLLALEAVLDDLARLGGADGVVDLGDCVSGPLWPRETMARLDRLGARTVRGNHDRQVATLPAEAMGPSDRFALGELDAGSLARLGALPPSLEAAPGVLAFHASPGRDALYLIEEVADGRLVRAPVDRIAARAAEAGPARLLLCGHSHRADLVRLEGGALVMNPGSVGCPAYEDDEPPAHVSESGSPHARYALVDLGAPGGEPGFAFRAVPYDHEAAARRAEANGRPDWAFGLRHGRMPPSAGR